MDKKTLDELLEKHKSQPVGFGYIDIIVSRDNYKDFISELVNNGYIIESISWWEWCPDEKENNYGLGGPKSIYYEGWFSELAIDLDDIKLPTDLEINERISEIINKITTKTISFPNEIITFNLNEWLTPAFWLDVPDDWRNKYSS